MSLHIDDLVSHENLTLDDCKRLDVVKNLSKKGHHADGIFLLKGGIVKKTYSKKYENAFANEVDKLKRLKRCKFVPKIIAIDKPNLTYYMTYCGNPVDSLDEYKREVKEMEDELLKKYGIIHNDITSRNVCKKDGKLYLIDFGWARTFKRGKAGGLPGHLGNIREIENDKVDGEIIRDWVARVLCDPDNHISNSYIKKLENRTGWKISLSR